MSEFLKELILQLFKQIEFKNIFGLNLAMSIRLSKNHIKIYVFGFDGVFFQLHNCTGILYS